jgi:ribosome maturation protein Sdo1
MDDEKKDRTALEVLIDEVIDESNVKDSNKLPVRILVRELIEKTGKKDPPIYRLDQALETFKTKSRELSTCEKQKILEILESIEKNRT